MTQFPIFYQGGVTQMRFQPGLGRLLAAAADNLISILDVETLGCILKLQVSCELCLYMCNQHYILIGLICLNGKHTSIIKVLINS